MNLLPYFQWVSETPVGQAITRSSWLFAVIESVHLLALAVIGGAVLVLDLRLLGLGLRDQPIERVARDAHPWLVGSLIVMIVSGVLLFSSEPIKCYYSTPFWVKMSSLALAMIFAFTVRKNVALAGEGPADDGLGSLHKSTDVRPRKKEPTCRSDRGE